MKEELKYSLEILGELSVMMTGISMMLQLYAISWDIHMLQRPLAGLSLGQALEPYGWTMWCVMVLSNYLDSVCSQAGETTIVITLRMPALFVLVCICGELHVIICAWPDLACIICYVLHIHTI